MAFYPAQFEHYSDDEILVSFRDLPECITSGSDEAEAMSEALDVLEVGVIRRMDDAEEIPVPSALLPGERYVEVSLAQALQIWRDSPCRQCRTFSGDALDAYLASDEDLDVDCEHTVERDPTDCRLPSLVGLVGEEYHRAVALHREFAEASRSLVKV